jgi:uncharacterized protein (TIGR00106 family)
MAILEISIVPVGTASTSLSPLVAQAISIVQGEKDISFEMTGMGTIIEGELPRLLELAAKMHEAGFSQGAKRVVTTIRIDDRRDKRSSVAAKIQAVKKRLSS